MLLNKQTVTYVVVSYGCWAHDGKKWANETKPSPMVPVGECSVAMELQMLC